MTFGTGANPLNLNTTTYNYVQIDFLAAPSGAVATAWEMFHADTNSSTIGAPSNSVQNIGVVPLSTTAPFSVVVDLATGGTGASAWDGTANQLRFDMFQGNAANKGKTFTITAVTFGSALVPVPETSTSMLLVGSLSMMLLRRRRI